MDILNNPNLITFRQQIDDDLKVIQTDYKNLNSNISDINFAFLYWILTKIYNEEETECNDLITEYSDKGIDAFEFFEDSKELFIIQAKHYDMETAVKTPDLSDFLSRPLSFLNSGNYKKSQELQKHYNKAIKDHDFHIHMQFYTTSVKYSNDIGVLINEFNRSHRDDATSIDAEFIDLSGLYKKYYGESYKPLINFTFNLGTVNKGTIAGLREEYNIKDLRCETYYVITPVSEIYRLKKETDDKGYSLFEENIREYLGDSSVNKRIIDTLNSSQFRNNFLFYNNGITLICKDAGKVYQDTKDMMSHIPLINPQVVNGCQTVNSIFEVLKKYNDDEIKSIFSGVYVMTKVLIIQTEDEDDKVFYRQVVQFTNSQNAVPDKVFAANEQPIFTRLQNSLLERGIFLKVKQSDKFQFNKKFDYQKKQELLAKASIFAKKVGYECKLSDISIDLDKFLQIMLVFRTNAQTGYQKKSHVLKRDSQIFKNYSLKVQDDLSVDNMLYIYFLYKRALQDQEKDKQNIALYEISFMTYLLQKNHSSVSFNQMASDIFNLGSSEFENFYALLKAMSSMYYGVMKLDYNTLIKRTIDDDNLQNCINAIKNVPVYEKCYDLLNRK